MELRNQLSVRWESNDENRERMEQEYNAWVESGRVGDEADDGVSPAHVAPLMSTESSREATHRSVNLQEPGVCEIIGEDGEEEEEEEEDAAPTANKKRKGPPSGYYLGSGGSTQGASMGASMEFQSVWIDR